MCGFTIIKTIPILYNAKSKIGTTIKYGTIGRIYKKNKRHNNNNNKIISLLKKHSKQTVNSLKIFHFITLFL